MNPETINYNSDLPDEKSYFGLFETTGWNKDYKINSVQLIKTLSKSWFWICAYHNNELVGSGRIVSDGLLHAVIFDLIVKPCYQRIGIGSKIMTKLLEHCYKKQIKDIQLFSAAGKKGFYLKQGFVSRPQNAPGMEIKKI